MDASKWQSLGWRHPVWDLVRYYLSLRGNKADEWLTQLRETKEMTVGEADAIPIAHEIIEHFFNYLADRKEVFNKLFKMLRSEKQALAYCTNNGICVTRTITKNRDHHQSSKAIVATVNHEVQKLCSKHRITFNPNPQTRCAWCRNNKFHVTSRNVDGAIPAVANPLIIWEIKEYWGKTGGGSKMSDAVYECNLVGRELREFEEQVKTKIYHLVFLDGQEQWATRKSDLKRFIDLTNQGLIDFLIVGKEVETDLPALLERLLNLVNLVSI